VLGCRFGIPADPTRIGAIRTSLPTGGNPTLLMLSSSLNVPIGDRPLVAQIALVCAAAGSPARAALQRRRISHVARRRAVTVGKRGGPVSGLGSKVPSGSAIAARLFVTERTVEAHVKQIFLKLGLNTDPDSHRRVLAVLAYLRSSA
jgi:hypothetical protein